MQIVQLDEKIYKNQPFTVKYRTKGYYDIRRSGTTFSLEYVPFGEEKELSFDDKLLSDWLDHPIALGAFEGETMLGFVEGFHEKWNNRCRISNIHILEGNRGRGTGSALMQAILAAARESGARMAVLETQTCNERAIAFYRKMGFEIIGFDLYAYTNQDPERHEVRLEMGLKL